LFCFIQINALIFLSKQFMKKLFLTTLLVLIGLSAFALRVQDSKTNAWATYYTTNGYDRSITNGWVSTWPQTSKNGVYFMQFKNDGDFLTSQLFDVQKNALAIVMEIQMPSGGLKTATLYGLNADSVVVETLNVELDGADFTSGTNKYFNEARFILKNTNRDIRRVRFEYGNDPFTTQYLRMQWFEIRDTTVAVSPIDNIIQDGVEMSVSNQFLTVKGVQSDATVQIYTVLGTELLRQPLVENRLFVGQLPKGIYVVRVGKTTSKVIF